MRALARRLRATDQRTDRGVALLIVIGLGMVMLALVATALTVAVSGLKKADTDQDWNGALDAAYAGVEEYQSRLATDNSYYTYGDKTAPFSVLTGSTKLTLPTGASANPAFGLGITGTWATVPQSTPIASYRYEVDNSHYADSGAIRVRVTGRVGDVTRSIVADLKQSGFIDYLYFTDYEVQDPDVSGHPECKLHIWEGRSTSTSGSNPCRVIQFGATDVIDGPLHSNDTLSPCGNTFNGKVTTSNPNTPIINKASGCANATYAVGTGAVYQPPINMPPTNVQMKKETRNDLISTEVPIPGCLYTGPTVITFTAAGKMNIKSPWTIKTQISETSTIPSAAPAQCGVPGTAAGALGSPEGATIDVIPANVLYVQNVPVLNTDPNWRAGTPAGFTCVASDGWILGSSSTTLTQYPAIGEQAPEGADLSQAYGCKNGDVFVQGTLKGAITVAAENYIYVTGDLKYADPAKDILGLVGNGAVFVWNPIKSSTGKPILTDTGRTIQAAILSVAHTFQVQNYDLGTQRGILTIKGSIAQTFRGPVALSGSTGYVKAYKYDTRFAYMAPPKFLSPVSSSYGVSQFSGVPAAFTATGATK